MTAPLLLLSPHESRDRGGSVTPTIVGTIEMVAGVYGPAWKSDTATSANMVTFPGTSLLPQSGADVTVIARLRYHTVTNTGGRYPVTVGGNPGVLVGRNPAGAAMGFVAAQSIYALDDIIPIDTPTVTAIRYMNGRRSIHVNGYPRTTVAGPPPTFTGGALYALRDAIIESVVIHPGIPDAEIMRISTLPEAWTWENTTVPDRSIFPVLKIGSPHIGPLRAGKA